MSLLTFISFSKDGEGEGGRWGQRNRSSRVDTGTYRSDTTSGSTGLNGVEREPAGSSVRKKNKTPKRERKKFCVLLSVNTR